MSDNANKRIAIFEYDWSMYSFIKDFAFKLADAGYLVDIFYKDWDAGPNCTDLNQLNRYENIRFFDFTTRATRIQVLKRRYQRLLNRLAMLLSVPRNERPDEIIDPIILNKTKEIVRASRYYCFIGIEKKGLIWAGMLSEKYNCPLVYHSLELYTEDNPALDRFYHLLGAERKYHKQAVATIVQDELRADVLLRSNGIDQTNVLCYPVCVRGGILQERSKYLQKKFDIGDDKKILLYFGNLDESRCGAQMVRMAENLDDDIVLVVHGWGRKKYLDYLRSIADKKKVVFSWDFLAEDEITSMVSSSHIGIALYDTRNFNDRLVAFASSKIAYYAQCGIPMIAYDTESLRQLVDACRCAELITSIDEMPKRARKILQDYDFLRQQCYAAYQRFYTLDGNFTRLLHELEIVVDGEQSVIGKDSDNVTVLQGSCE